MEGIEMRARRVLLGLSVQEAARLTRQNEKHWREWEAGSRPVPDGAAAAIRQLYATIVARVDAGVEAAASIYDDTHEPVPLVAYKTIQAFEEAGGEEHYELPWSGHSSLIGLVLFACEYEGISAYVHGVHHAD